MGPRGREKEAESVSENGLHSFGVQNNHFELENNNLEPRAICEAVSGVRGFRLPTKYFAGQRHLFKV